ncbi:MAG TPA: L,D-transpeptidase [Thermoanaerobaculia bacterium]
MKSIVSAAAALLLLVSLPASADKPKFEPYRSEVIAIQTDGECHWWRAGCPRDPEGLPPEAPRQGTVITVDTGANVAYLYRDGALVLKGAAATGMDKMLTKGLRKWLFRTPRGRHRIVRKVVDPIWVKPDWAFIEEGKAIPPQNARSRRVPGKLGRYALDLGDGIMIHGTDDPTSLGRKVSHGCIRVGDELLKKMYRASDVGTEVWIF